MGAIIKVTNITEKKNGKMSVTFEYDNDLKETVRLYYGVEKATKQKIKDFFHQAIMEGVLRHKRKGFGKIES